MEKLEYTEEIEKIVNKDCKKIMNEIVELYKNHPKIFIFNRFLLSKYN